MNNPKSPYLLHIVQLPLFFIGLKVPCKPINLSFKYVTINFELEPKSSHPIYVVSTKSIFCNKGSFNFLALGNSFLMDCSDTSLKGII